MGNKKICVVGAGNWGINHIKTLRDLKVLVSAVEPNPIKSNSIMSLFPDVDVFNSIEDSFQFFFDGYILATPPSTHLRLAKLIIKKGMPVLVEKPLVLSTSEAENLSLELEKRNGKLLVGHLLLFHPAIIKIKSMIENGDIGNLRYIYSTRLNLGTVRNEENVLWSFSPHDISLFQYFTDSFPVKVSSSGGIFLQKKIYDSALTYIKYPNGVEGHIYASWMHPFKEQRIVVIGSKGALHFEDSTHDKSLIFYSQEAFDNKKQLLFKSKAPKKIHYGSSLPLKNELIYFLNIIDGEEIKKATFKEGLDVIKILEMASDSLKNQ